MLLLRTVVRHSFPSQRLLKTLQASSSALLSATSLLVEPVKSPFYSTLATQSLHQQRTDAMQLKIHQGDYTERNASSRSLRRASRDGCDRGASSEGVSKRVRADPQVSPQSQPAPVASIHLFLSKQWVASSGRSGLTMALCQSQPRPCPPASAGQWCGTHTHWHHVQAHLHSY